MKRGVKLYLLLLAFIVLISFVILISYKPVTISSIDSQIEYAYVPNGRSGNVSVINTDTNEVEYSVDVGADPEGVVITPDGTRVYVTNSYLNNVSVIDTATNNVISMVPVGHNPIGITVSFDGKTVY